MKYFAILIFGATFLVLIEGQSRRIKFTNRCNKEIWVSPLTNGQGQPLRDGIVRLGNGASYTYNIPDGGWGGRFWPKTGCESNGQNCKVGQSMAPCPNGGCQPPAETKVEFFYPRVGDSNGVWYDISLVDGYSLPVEIIPSQTGGSCRTTRCTMALNQCPTNENHVGDLRVQRNGETVMCLAPCKKWNYPSPYGYGRDEKNEPGLYLCCPTPPVSPEQCRKNIVVNTQYVKLIHQTCPTAYSYSYDDEAGLHNCPNRVNFDVNFCP